MSRSLSHALLCFLVVFSVHISAHAQQTTPRTSPQHTSVPFLGCHSDGQVGPLKAPKGTSLNLAISAAEGQHLAYYKSAQGIGVLAPRGWNCFAVYGSGGETLYVKPGPMSLKDPFNYSKHSFTGPGVEVARRYGGTSGRFHVAKMIALVFPTHSSFLDDVIENFDMQRADFPAGPYPTDTLTYRGNNIVEYTTPALEEGLGTWSSLGKDGNPIQGAAILAGQTPDLIVVSVRLPPDLVSLTAVIVRHCEGEAEHFRP